MNRERARSLLPIIQAFADGKDIQVRPRTIEKLEWSTNPPDPGFFNGDEYRIKPEPKELWVMVYNNKTSTPSFSSSYQSEKDATDYMQALQKDNPMMFDDAYVVKVREVLE